MKKMRITRDDYIKANRKASREAEIQDHTHPISFKRVHKSKKVYDRKRSKAENKKALPYLFLVGAPQMDQLLNLCLVRHFIDEASVTHSILVLSSDRNKRFLYPVVKVTFWY